MTPPANPAPPAAATPSDDGEVLFRIDTRSMPESIKKDLEANAHLARTTPENLLAQRLSQRLAAFGVTVRAA